MQKEEVIFILKKSDIFKGLKEEFYQKYAHLFHFQILKKNEGIDNGDLLKYLFIINSGEMKICFHDPVNGKTIAPFLLTPYESFDLVCTIDHIYNATEYEALDDVSLLKIQSSFIKVWMEEYPQLNINMLHALTKILRELEHFSESLVFYDVKTRLADIILRLALKEKKRLESEIDIPYSLTHETLAQMVGSVRSVVTTALKELKSEGVIIDKRAHLIIKNLEKLKKLIPSFN